VVGTLVGQPTLATDPDPGDTAALVYHIVQQPGPPLYFAMNPSTAQWTVIWQLPNDNSLVSVLCNVSCTDPGGITTLDTVKVLMSATNNPPVQPNFARSVAENSLAGALVGLPVLGTDPTVGQTATLTYTITGGNSPSVFLIGLNSAQITDLLPLDYETVPSYSLTITATNHPVVVRSARLMLRRRRHRVYLSRRSARAFLLSASD
jgi:hypothetical protein